MYNFYDGGEGVSEERDEIEVGADASVDHHQHGDMMMLDVKMLDVFHNLSVHEKYQISYVRVPITHPSLVLS